MTMSTTADGSSHVVGHASSHPVVTDGPKSEKARTPVDAGGSGRDALASLRIDRDPPRRRRRWPWLMLLLLVMAVGLGWGVASNRIPSGQLLQESSWVPDIMQNRVDVRLTELEIQKGRSAEAVIVATGYLRSHRQAGIGARTPGRIDVISFEEGDKVSRGDVLAELDHKDLDASLAAAAASVAKAEAAVAEQEILILQADTDRERALKLRKGRGISESEYDQARFSHLSAVARLKSLRADVDLMKAQMRQNEQLLENMFIRAPFDGTVISKDAEEGESILPGGTGGNSGRGSVATIADLDHLEIECDVQEGFISRVNEGQEVDISVDAVPDKKYHGVVDKILPMGDRARATIKVRVKISDADDLLFPEMSGTVYFLPDNQVTQVSEEPRMFCDEDCVTRDIDGDSQVWTVDENKRAQPVSVEIGETRDGRTEIISGVSGRPRLIDDPSELSPGMPVRIVE
ncbi:efflux RND transporter periplasmic adaptor subunit [Rubripirellula amarantea]|nr:efflux RND transporter periplasmic adaptor subunit [Rubripirellula amarantea]